VVTERDLGGVDDDDGDDDEEEEEKEPGCAVSVTQHGLENRLRVSEGDEQLAKAVKWRWKGFLQKLKSRAKQSKNGWFRREKDERQANVDDFEGSQTKERRKEKIKMTKRTNNRKYQETRVRRRLANTWTNGSERRTVIDQSERQSPKEKTAKEGRDWINVRGSDARRWRTRQERVIRTNVEYGVSRLVVCVWEG
jgi:hypothetical protein